MTFGISIELISVYKQKEMGREWKEAVSNPLRVLYRSGTCPPSLSMDMSGPIVHSTERKDNKVLKVGPQKCSCDSRIHHVRRVVAIGIVLTIADLE